MMVPRIEIFDPTARGLEESLEADAGAGAGRGAELVDITNYSTPCAPRGILGLAIFWRFMEEMSRIGRAGVISLLKKPCISLFVSWQ